MPDTSSPSSSPVVSKGGYRAMAAKPNAKTYAASEQVAGAKLPKKVDLRPFMTKIEDQGQTSSCVANAVAGAYEYSVKRGTQQDYDVSRLYVYYNARWRNKDQAKDEGSYIQYAMEGLQKFGACPEKTWPFDKALLLQKPNQDSYKEGAEGRVKEMRKVPLELAAWKQALAEGLPIVFGCILFDSFDECKKRGGVVPMPSPEEITRKEHGGHSMCCVGYSDVDGVFIVRNSWGKNWADGGYCYMPYNYLINPKFNDGDCWVFTPPHPLPPPVETWIEDDKPVVNNGRGVNFKINEYSIESYSSVAVNLFAVLAVVEWSSILSESYQEYASYVREQRFDLMEQYSVSECIASYSETSVESSSSEFSSESVEVSEETSSEEESEDEESEEEESEDGAEEEESEDDAEEEESEDDAEEEESEDGAEEEESEDDAEEEESEDGAEEEESEDEAEEEESEDEAEEEESEDEAEEEEEEEEAEEEEEEAEEEEEEAEEEEEEAEEEESDDEE